MSDHLVELPAPVMSEAAFQRRREHLLAELERPAGASAAALAVVLGGRGRARGVGVRSDQRRESCAIAWLPASEPGGLRPHRRRRTPAEVQNFTDDWNDRPPRPAHLQGGKPLPARRGILLSGLGPAGDTITAYPTSNGAVCYMIEGAGSCTNLKKWPWNTVGFTFGIFSTHDGGTRIFGIAADKVTAVSVEIAGVEQPAILEQQRPLLPATARRPRQRHPAGHRDLERRQRPLCPREHALEPAARVSRGRNPLAWASVPE